ncbi:MAG: hypothetical protein AAF226_12380, partial [Verrucomicrobiota bacterium]
MLEFKENTGSGRASGDAQEAHSRMVNLKPIKPVDFEPSSNAFVVLKFLWKIREEVGSPEIFELVRHDKSVFEALGWGLCTLAKYLLSRVCKCPGLTADQLDRRESLGQCLRRVLSIALYFVKPNRFLFALFQRLFREISEYSKSVQLSLSFRTNLSSEIIKIRDQLFGALFS